jgi:predicted MFS family arabinose efflux permease
MGIATEVLYKLMDSCVTEKLNHATSGKRISTRAGFFSFGLLLAAWAPLAPLAKIRLGLSDSEFGFTILLFGVGSLIAMPAGAALSARFGCRKVVLAFAPVVCASLLYLAETESVAILQFSLFMFGFGIGVTESAMNLQSVIVQKAHEQPLMSGFHAWFSVGGIIGAIGVSSLLSAHVSPLNAVRCLVGTVLAIWCVLGRYLIPSSYERSGFTLAFPTLYVLWAGMLCFITFLAEGAMLDWSGVLLVMFKGFAQENAGYGYGAFAAAMTAGRLLGDRLTSRFGTLRILFWGPLFAAMGFFALVALGQPIVLFAAFCVVGFGLANVVPLIFLNVSRQRAMSVEVAMPVAAMLGYAGMLTGPAGLGSIAERAGLPTSFIVVAALLLIVSLSAKPLSLLRSGD